jgi:bifunctional non-homologous end joining protein LigD
MNFTKVDGASLLKAAELAGLEGVVAKRLTSPYRPGRRSSDWTKTALVKTQEVILVGYRPGEGRRAGTIGSLLLAAFDEHDQLIFVGHVGTGFIDVELRSLQRQLDALSRATPALPSVPREYVRHAR